MSELHQDASLVRRIERLVAADPSAHCFSIYRQGTWHPETRIGFWGLVERYALLFAATFEPSSLVLFIKRLDADLLAAYVGAIRAGVLPAMLSPISAKTTPLEYERKIQHILHLTRAAGLFTDRDPPPMQVDCVQLSPDSQEPPAGPSWREQHQAFVQFSSGSTGLQKGVVISHAGLLAHMEDYAAAIQLNPSDRLVSWLPLYHDMGLIACFMLPLLEGIPFLLMDPFDWIMKPDLLLEAIAQERATLCFLPNFAYHVLINKGKTRDLSGVRLFINCSEPVRSQTHQAFQERFPSVAQQALSVCYALAENTFAVSQVPPGAKPDPRHLEGKEVPSCGIVLSRTEVRILDPNAEGVGEIAIRGPYLFERYLGGEHPLDEGFYRTGDLGLLTDAGELFVTGRKKDLVIVNGKNLYPQDVEACCNTLPGVYPGRSVAFGITNEATGSEELFVLVERDGSVEDTPLKLSVQRAVESEVGIVPRRVEVLDHMRLVKTSSGKISRSRNKELYLQGEFS